ncbi:DNA polymerase [Pseudoxanthobacter soli DSM 19599]|uniref:Type-4 uracil-DNA glycosylase n=1 Tax=Pseudoxanthobacter soli DSM 19599 TaxID=1123029 RepID=A0A1M7Z5J6_9HYPH|nr:uracil-DNA glycosylase [Pseudoxanthobacter soli]SHO60114.1 DNA polymerase [Pseudoxanthobacter soli DSM 19599]
MSLSDGDRRAELAALIELYDAMGVDAVVSDVAPDRFKAVEKPQAFAPAAPPPSFTRSASAGAAAPGLEPRRFVAPPESGTPGATVPDDAAIADARALASAATSLDELRETLARFEGCNLRKTATRLVFADGNPAARLMFVGEAPGREEDIAGLPFVGRSGRLLDLMLAAIGLDRSSVYIANVVPWRPPGNRTPSPQETEICKPFITRQIELVAPEVLVFLGGASSKALTGSSDGIRKLRGRWMTVAIGGREIRAMATLHPAYLLRQPLEKRLAWRDFRAIRSALAG